MTSILVADDSDVVRLGLNRLIGQHEGWQVCREAVDGLETVAKARQLSPDVVVLDFSMPLLNGIDAARQIRREKPATRFVLCSMYLDEQLASVARNEGFTSLVSKSNVRGIIDGIEAVLRDEVFNVDWQTV